MFALDEFGRYRHVLYAAFREADLDVDQLAAHLNSIINVWSNPNLFFDTFTRHQLILEYLFEEGDDDDDPTHDVLFDPPTSPTAN